MPWVASAIARVLAEPGLGTRLAAAGIERARACSMDLLAARYVGLYERALRMEDAAETVIAVPRMLRRFEHRFLRRPRKTL